MSYQKKGKPWAFGIDVTDCKTSKEVMQKADLDFIVDKCDLMARMPFGLNRDNSVNEIAGEFAYNSNVYREVPNCYGTYRVDKNIPLGLVGAKYEVIQNTEAFDFFDGAIGKDMAIFDRACCLNDGAKVYVSAKLPDTIKVGGDLVDNYLVFSNSHDGSSSVNIMFTPMRVICTNMLNSALSSSDSYIRIRHTKTAKEKLDKGKDILRIACKYASEAQELYNAIFAINMSDADVKDYFLNLVLSTEERIKLNEYDKFDGVKKLMNKDYNALRYTNISIRKVNILTDIWNYYNEGIGQESILGTGWGAYNAVTGYYSNVANIDGEKRFVSLLYGGANKSSIKALNEIYNHKIA